jgi:hypothetical protein
MTNGQLLAPRRTVPVVAAVLMLVAFARVLHVGGSGGADQAQYQVTGSGTAQITYQADNGLSQSTRASLPWSSSLTMGPGIALSISALSLDGGAVTCAITIGGSQVAGMSSLGSCNANYRTP